MADEKLDPKTVEEARSIRVQVSAEVAVAKKIARDLQELHETAREALALDPESATKKSAVTRTVVTANEAHDRVQFLEERERGLKRWIEKQTGRSESESPRSFVVAPQPSDGTPVAEFVRPDFGSFTSATAHEVRGLEVATRGAEVQPRGQVLERRGEAAGHYAHNSTRAPVREERRVVGADIACQATRKADPVATLKLTPLRRLGYLALGTRPALRFCLSR